MRFDTHVTARRLAIIGNAAGPLTNFRAPLIKALASNGHEMFALAPDFSVESRELIVGLGAVPVDFSLARTGLNPFVDWRDVKKLRDVLLSLRLDAVLSFGIKPAIYGTIAASLAHVPARHVLITGLGYAFTDSGETSVKRRLVATGARFLYRLALRRAENVFMQNPDDAADFVRWGIVEPGKLTTVNGTGVELDRWQPAAPMRSPITFLLAARMLRDKGVVEFVEAARVVKGRHTDTRFVLVGGQDINPEAIPANQLEAWVKEGVVEWPGHVEMRTWLAQTSVFVLPSYREGIPRSTQEAMAMGRPVITTDVPGCRETVVDGRNGFLVPPRDPAAIAVAMERFISDPERIVIMGLESRKLAEERFDVRRVNEVMMSAMGL